MILYQSHDPRIGGPNIPKSPNQLQKSARVDKWKAACNELQMKS